MFLVHSFKFMTDPLIIFVIINFMVQTSSSVSEANEHGLVFPVPLSELSLRRNHSLTQDFNHHCCKKPPALSQAKNISCHLSDSNITSLRPACIGSLVEIESVYNNFDVSQQNPPQSDLSLADRA